MERLLTDTEIDKILNENQNNPVFLYTGCILASREKESLTDVMVLSYTKRLIMIRGNDDTGHEHIRARHNFWSPRSYTVEYPDKSRRVQNQSKFPEQITLFDELRIAEEIYKPQNLIKNNSHPMASKFDLYIGETNFERKEKEKVKLLLYKGTKIIHSLFPSSSKYTRKRLKNFPFYRGNVEVFRNPSTGIKQVTIPYYNLNDEHVHEIFIEKFEKEGKEVISILSLFNNGNRCYKRKLSEREINIFDTDTHERVTYQYSDLREIEKYILKIDKKEI